MKIGWKAVLWLVPVVLAILAIVVATSYPTAKANTASWSPILAAIPVGLGNFLSKRIVLFLLTAVVSIFLTYKITYFLTYKQINRLIKQIYTADQNVKSLQEQIKTAREEAAIAQQQLTDARSDVEEANQPENVLGSIIEKAQMSRFGRPLYPPSIDQLTYAVREVVSALLEPGILNDEIVGLNMGKIKQEGPAWHIAANYNLRKNFIRVVDQAVAARQPAGNAAYCINGDYKPEEREHYAQILRNCSDKLIDHLNNNVTRMRTRTVV